MRKLPRKELLYPFMEHYMRVLTFAPYEDKMDKSNIIFLVLHRAITWPSNQAQGGDRKQRENLIQLLDLFEAASTTIQQEVRSQETGGMTLIELPRLKQEGAVIELPTEKLFDLLKSCVAKLVAESPLSVRDTISAELFLDNVPLVAGAINPTPES